MTMPIVSFLMQLDVQGFFQGHCHNTIFVFQVEFVKGQFEFFHAFGMKKISKESGGRGGKAPRS